MKRLAWKPADVRSPTRWWLKHRLLPLVLVLGVGWLFVYLLLQPFMHPRVHLLFAAAPYVEAELGATAAPERDLATLHLPHLELLGADDGTHGAGVWASVGWLDEQFDRLDNREIRSRDILLVWLRAQPVTIDGQVHLLSGDFDPADDRSGRYPLARVLERVRRSPARSKVIFLDGGRTVHAPRLGIFAESSPQQIRSLVQDTGDTSLWVLVSHSELESAQDLPESHRSALATLVAEGLRGQADRNEDGLVDLGELADYVRSRLAADGGVRVGDEAIRESAAVWRRQHPQVVWGGGPVRPTTKYPLVAPVVPPTLDLGSDPRLPGARAAADGLAADPADSENAAPTMSPSATEQTTQTSPEDSADGDTTSEQPAVSPETATAPELVSLARSLFQTLAESPLRPRQRAPHLWRALHNHVNNLEIASREDQAVPDAAAVDELRRLVMQLDDLAAGRQPPRFGRLDLVAELKRWAGGAEPVFKPHSLALEEVRAEQLGRPVPPEVNEAIEQFDAVVAEETAEGFAEWIGELPDALDVYVECRLARALGNRPELPWPSVRKALRVTRIAETAAAATWNTGVWTRPTIERADRLRLQGERRLLSGVQAADADQADWMLARAAAEYDQAMAIHTDVTAVRQAVETLLFQFPDWFRGAIQSLSTPTAEPVDVMAARSLLDEVAQAVDLLDHPSTSRLPELRRVRSELQRSLQHSAAWNGNSDRRERMDRTESSGATSRDAQLRQLGQISELYGRWLQIVAGQRIQDEPVSDILSVSRRLADTDGASPAYWTACSELGENLRTFQRQLPVVVDRLVAQNSDLTDPTTRPERIRHLREAWRMLYLVHPWDVGRLTGPGPAELFRRAERYDFFAWQQRRLEQAVQDAVATERGHLINAATAYHQAAIAIARQPPLPGPIQPQLQITAPQRIDLIGVPQQEVVLTVTNRHAKPLDAWIFCDYDPQMLEVSPGLDDVMYDQSTLVSLTQATVGGSVADPSEVAGREPSFRLRPSETGSLRLRIRRRTPTGRAARIVFRAVSEAQVVRHDSAVDLPRSPDLDLQIEGSRDTWQWTENQWTLYPFPNRTTSYQLYLVNPGVSARTVDFQLLPAPRASAVAPPPGEVAAEVADDYLAKVEASDAVLLHQGIVAPAGGAPVPISLLPSAPENGAEQDDEAEAPTPLPPVLLAVATDMATGRKTIRRLEILVQRPSRYVEPRVYYDPQSGRVEILVRPLTAVPPAGISITCLPPPSADGQIRGRATALLQPGMTETRLHVQVPPDAGPVFPVTIDVDDFERAFRYEVPTTAAVRTAVPPSNRIQVRIVEPKAGKSFGPKPEAIDVSLQVDVPYALLWDGSSWLEVGIDVDRDRTLVGEPSVRVTSDRLVELHLDPDVADGTLAIATRTGDLVVTLPPTKVRAGRANLLARAILPDQDVWSEPVEVVFDDEAPQISRVQLMPGRSVAQGEPLEISLLASDGELSGVARVEAAFDLEGRGEFTPETKPIPGAMQSDGRWRIDLPTAPVNPGVYHVLIQAVDRVGNKSEYQRTRVEVLAKDAAGPAMDNRIAGRVVFGRLAKAPAAGIAVRLIEDDKPIRERRSDKDGQFVFDKVPPGDYRLEAAGLIAGNRRTGTMQLEVPPAPEAIPPIELILQTEQ